MFLHWWGRQDRASVCKIPPVEIGDTTISKGVGKVRNTRRLSEDFVTTSATFYLFPCDIQDKKGIFQLEQGQGNWGGMYVMCHKTFLPKKKERKPVNTQHLGSSFTCINNENDMDPSHLFFPTFAIFFNKKEDQNTWIFEILCILWNKCERHVSRVFAYFMSWSEFLLPFGYIEKIRPELTRKKLVNICASTFPFLWKFAR